MENVQTLSEEVAKAYLHYQKQETGTITEFGVPVIKSVNRTTVHKEHGE